MVIVSNGVVIVAFVEFHKPTEIGVSRSFRIEFNSFGKLYRLKGELLLAESNDQTGAEEWFSRAIETAERQGSKAWKLRATTSMMRLWQKQGHREKAFTVLSSVYGLFTEGSATPDLADAAALYESLADARMRAEFAAGLRYVRECIPALKEGVVWVDWRWT